MILKSSLRSVRGLSFKRAAVTLVELLVVLGIVTLLAALILPTVKGLLADRKSSQSAILVKNYLEAARSRAIGKNRSVSVVLERLSGRAADKNGDGIINLVDAGANPNYVNRFESATASGFAPTVAVRTSLLPDTNFLPYNACIKLSMAEEPLPVTNRLLPVEVVITSRFPGDSLSPPIPNNYDVAAQLGTGSISETRIFQVTALSGNVVDVLGDYLISGNEISLEDTSPRFTITSPSSRLAHKTYDDNAGLSTIFFAVQNNRGINGLGELAERPYINIPPGRATSLFKIFLKPKPIYTQALQLPKGACIDLSLSGFASNNNPALEDYRVRFASDWVLGGLSGVPTPEELRPIHLVFSPDGKLSRVYANEKGSQQSLRIDCVEDIFLHIGLIDQVFMPYDTTTRIRTTAALALANTGGVKQNLTDPSSYVVRLSPKSGAISAAPITQFLPAAGDTYFDIVDKSRAATFTSTITGQ